MKDGYLLPDQLEPVDDLCFRVYVPNMPEYRRAFLGAYTSLGMWTVWERDSRKGGSIAASRWRDSIDKTLESWPDGCGCGDDGVDDMTPDELRELIAEELKKMTITINNTNNCGCCGGGTSSGTVVSDGSNLPPDGYDTPVIVPIEPVDTVDNVDKCNRVGFLLVTYRTAVLQAIEKVSGTFTDAVGWFAGLWNWLFVGDFSFDDWTMIRGWISVGNLTDFEDFTHAYDTNFDAMVCSAYSSLSAADAKDVVRELLENYVWSELSVYGRLVAKRIFELVPFGVAFDKAIAADIPPGYQNRKCCGQEPVNALLGLWVPWYSGATEAYPYDGVLTSYRESVNVQDEVDCELVLKRTAQYTPYQFSLIRTCVMPDASQFAVTIRQNGHTAGWKVRLLGNASVLAEKSGSGAEFTLDFAAELAAGTIANMVTDVAIFRNEEVYATASPRSFNMEFEIETDSEEFYVWEYE